MGMEMCQRLKLIYRTEQPDTTSVTSHAVPQASYYYLPEVSDFLEESAESCSHFLTLLQTRQSQLDKYVQLRLNKSGASESDQAAAGEALLLDEDTLDDFSIESNFPLFTPEIFTNIQQMIQLIKQTHGQKPSAETPATSSSPQPAESPLVSLWSVWLRLYAPMGLICGHESLQPAYVKTWLTKLQKQHGSGKDSTPETMSIKQVRQLFSEFDQHIRYLRHQLYSFVYQIRCLTLGSTHERSKQVPPEFRSFQPPSSIILATTQNPNINDLTFFIWSSVAISK